MKRTIAAAVIASMASIGGAAFAKAPLPLPVRGTITSVNGSMLAIAENSGAKLSLTLAPDTKVIDVIPASLS